MQRYLFGVRVFADEHDKHSTESDLHDDFIVLEKSESFHYQGIVLNMTTIGNAKFDCTSVYNYDNNVECATSLVNQFNDFKRQTGIGKGLFVLRSLRGDSLIVVNEEGFVNIRILESRVNFVKNLVFRVESSCRDLLIKENKGYARFNRLYIQSENSSHKIKISFEDYLNFDEGKRVSYKGVNYMLWDMEDVHWRCTTECGSQLPINIFYERENHTIGLNIINKKFQLLDMTGIDNLIVYRNEYSVSGFCRKEYA